MKRNILNKLYSAWDLFWVHTDFFLSTLRSRLSLSFQGCPPGKGLRTSGRCHVKARRAGSIRIGHQVSLYACQRSNRVGLNNPVMLHTLGEGRIEIGDHTGGSSVVLSARSEIRIGRQVKMGGNVRIFDHDFHALDPAVRRTPEDESQVRTRPVIIGDDVFVGTNAMILKGTTIGARSIIGAGAVVAGLDVPPDSVVVGNPARIVANKRG
jgi:acetyltransferase-like isoleucine patch superfamily enzyme